MFRAAFRLFAKNWIIIVPGLVVGSAMGVLSWILRPSDAPLFESDRLSLFITNVAQVIASILAIAYTTGMAHAIWERGTATFADGRRAFARDAGHVFVAMLGLFVLGLVAMVLVPYTWWLSVVFYVYLVIYTMPAAVVGDRNGLRAILESGEIAVHRVVPTLTVVAGLIAIFVVAGLLAQLLAEVPVLGDVLKQVVVQAAVAYFTIVVVGEYLALRELAAVEAAQR